MKPALTIYLPIFCFTLALCQVTEDNANCRECRITLKGKCNGGNSPTTCDDTKTGCYNYKWQSPPPDSSRRGQWVKYIYPMNCRECLRKAKTRIDCNERKRTCTIYNANGTRNRVEYYNCDKAENCNWSRRNNTQC